MLQGKKSKKAPGHSFGLLAPAPLDSLYFVFSDWLLLQVSGRVFTEGNSLTLRCHAWENKRIHNLLFYQNDRTFKFLPQPSELTIPNVNMSHNGTYYCSAMGTHRYTSATVSITVKGTVSEYSGYCICKCCNPHGVHRGDEGMTSN